MQEESREPHTILVIEDNQDTSQLVSRILESKGYCVVLATDGVSGMSLLREVKPDLILLDIMMPGQDGYMTLASIRQHSNVPVIIVTAKSETEALIKAFDLGADDYVKKPFYPNELIARVKTKLRHI